VGYVEQVRVRVVCLFFTNKYPISFIKWQLQFNANGVVENHIQSYKSSINKIVQLSDINNHCNFSPSAIFNPSDLSSDCMFQSRLKGKASKALALGLQQNKASKTIFLLLIFLY